MKHDKIGGVDVYKRFTRIYPDGKMNFMENIDIQSIKFHPVTTRFFKNPDLEKLYQKYMISDANPRSFKIFLILISMYFLFTAINIINLFDNDPEVRSKAKIYVSIVYPPLIPIPFLLSATQNSRWQKYYQQIYTIILILLSGSFIGGGMYSMLIEWKYINTTETNYLLDFVGFDNSTQKLYLNSSISWWEHRPILGTRRDIMGIYLGEILFKAATMNVNLLRLMMVFVIVPIFKIDTIHFSIITIAVSLSYLIMIMVYFPSTDAKHFIFNKITIMCLTIIFPWVMVFRTKDFEHVMRLQFLHDWSVERAAYIVETQKEEIVKENQKLKEELAKQDNSIDFNSPVAKILTSCKEIQSSTNLSQDHQEQMSKIIAALGKLDDRLFTPDLVAQMQKSTAIDDDTKNWAMSTLGENKYFRKSRSKSQYSNALASNYLHSNDLTPEEDLKNNVMKRVMNDGWNTDFFEINEANHKPLYYLLCALYDYHDFKKYSDKTIFFNFANQINNGYIANDYHNAMHAADVLNGVHYIIYLSNGALRKKINSLEFFSILISAAIHDYGHPGNTNIFEVTSNSELAIEYSDSSVLEHMHLAEAFKVMNDPDYNILANFDNKDYRSCRKLIIEMVLATDLSQHLQLVGSLKTALLSEKAKELANDPMMIMKVTMKLCDIGHSSKARHLHIKWSSLIIEEFFKQGDREKMLGMDISPFMDRSSENSGNNQVGFFQFIVMPFYETVAQIFFDSTFDPILYNLRNNYNLWKKSVELKLLKIEDITEKVFNNENIGDLQKDN